ncbi:MAG: DUF4097 family beta strand repeat-containing protein [bacterium]|nr:hypothetical protein [Gammaproteobacteria bacterium]HIL98781.1 hypothetical protein [Pseudomonadales bacterium]
MRHLLSTILICLSFPALASACKEEKLITHSFASKDVSQLLVNALAGSLEVNGDDSDTITINARACADELKYLEQMTIDVDDSRDQLELTVIIPYRGFGWNADYAFMDLEITVPTDQLVKLRDSSGHLEVRDANVASIDDSSGDIRLFNISGDLEVSDSSGDIYLRGMTGNLQVNDSSGRIDIQDVDGDVVIPRDSSGDIDIDTVSGLVTIERDGSGSIEIENVKKGVNVHSDGSGDIRISAVQGSVKIGNDGSGSVRIAQVDGDFSIDAKGSGSIRTSGIKGSTDIPR